MAQDLLENLMTQFPGISWPRFLPPYGALLVSLAYQVEKSQSLPYAWHLQEQMKQASRLLQYAARHVPFYQTTPARFLQNELTYADWCELPILSRQQIQQAGKALVSRHLPKGHGRLAAVSTSGSTGMPVTCYTTEVTRAMFFANGLLEHTWHGRDLAGKHMAIRPSGDVKPGTVERGKSWLRPAETGPSILLNVRSDTRTQLRVLQEESPDYLLSLPSNLNALAELCRNEGVHLESLKEVRSIGEALSPGVRALCRETWGVPLTEVYSSQELGYLAFQCPEEGRMHALTAGVLLEVLDAEGQPCRPGEVGQVVVSSLLNYGSPLLRYALGDYAEVGETCACGRSMPVLNKVLGRQRNMLMLPDGRKIWPSFSVRNWAGDVPLVQFQFVQKSLEVIEARLVTERPLSSEEVARLTGALHERLQHPFEIDIRYLDEIPRSRSGKFEDFMSEIDQP